MADNQPLHPTLRARALSAGERRRQACREMILKTVTAMLLTSTSLFAAEVWHGVVLPSDVRVLDDAGGSLWGVYDYSATLSLRSSVDRTAVSEHFEETLRESWQRCEFDGAAWYFESGHSAEVQLWNREQTKQHLLVVIDDEGSGEGPGDVTLSLFEDSRKWELLQRGLCNPKDPSLYRPRALFLALHYCGDENGLRFTPNGWSKADAERRGRMVTDLLCGGHLLGLHEGEVLELLGSPDAERQGAFSYLIERRDDFEKKYVPPSPKGHLCKPGRYTLTFELSVTVEESGADQPFGVNPAFLCVPDA